MTPRQQQYVELAHQGLSQLEISRRLGVTASTVCKFLARAGVSAVHAPPGNRMRPCEEVLAPWRERIRSGEATRRQMSEHFHITLSTVCRWLEYQPSRQPRRSGYQGKPRSTSEQRSKERREREAAKRAALLAEMGGGR